MKQNLITDIIQGMLPYLSNGQTEKLHEVLQHTLFNYDVTLAEKSEEISGENLVESFLSAKKIEGCSEKTLRYYYATIQSMLDEIKQKNDAIEDEGISKKLDEIYDLSNKIFRLVIENPKKLPQIRRFMDYYLPMCLKILAGYSKMDKLKIENTVVTKEKVEASLELVRQAFKNQLSKLYRDDYLDVSTDMEVLEKLLEKDNLLDGRGFNIKVNSERAAGGATALASEEEKK